MADQVYSCNKLQTRHFCRNNIVEKLAPISGNSGEAGSNVLEKYLLW